jgi:hypothetical protein
MGKGCNIKLDHGDFFWDDDLENESPKSKGERIDDSEEGGGVLAWIEGIGK